ncbi:MFS general substrate transporter [Cylindrobasidium torrendii FP15055 ss-10]|uniref:MFS general substrate transporter n=1 Tax=Cylindrobasidium torrendii FP15055 ss-10 TaxID=1314674 RepID=A0A0D7B0S2_9AGAR|nr:MFS general substrate transporter [Cylindrobasidium torrendii FP15055 ss-10]
MAVGDFDDKVDVAHREHAQVEEDALPSPGSPERIRAERELVRRLDLRLLPIVFLIFIMNYIDRQAVTTARLRGLEEDLKLSDVQYSTLLSTLYATYCTAQIPSNMILNWIRRPSWYIGGCVVCWGTISALTGVTQSFGGILACRLILGLPEAAFYPGTVYLLSRWYTKKELAFRSAFLYSGLLISNAFGALLAAGILSNMEGKRGIRAWRWLFYIEHVRRVFVSICLHFNWSTRWALPDYPDNTRWISSFDRRLAQARLADDAGEADRDHKDESLFGGLILAVKDVRVWVFAILNVAQLLGLSFVNFFPTLTATLQYSTTISLVLAAPPWILAAISCCVNAWHADRTGERFFHVAGWWWCTVLGFIIALSSMNVGARYVSMFLMAVGYTGFAMTLVWVSNTVARPPAKRAAAIGLVNGIGNLGNLIGSYTWKSDWSPGYHPSMGISMGALVISSILSLGIRENLRRANKRMDADEKEQIAVVDKERVEEAARLEGITFEEAVERRKGFRYLY